MSSFLSGTSCPYRWPINPTLSKADSTYNHHGHLISPYISALPVSARVLHDLEIIKSAMGLTTLSAFVVNDILGWMIFMTVLSLTGSHEGNLWRDVTQTFVGFTLFAAFSLTLGSALVNQLILRLRLTSLPQTSMLLSFISCLALLCGTFTQRRGLHAILGFFFAGIMVGNASHISERSRDIITQMVHAVFVPIFFATIGLKIDFFVGMDPLITICFCAVYVGGKFWGAWIGCPLGHVNRADIMPISVAHIPGGSMEIILAMLALEIKLITPPVFVAIVFAAIASALFAGPMISWALRRSNKYNVGNFVYLRAINLHLDDIDRFETLRSLCRSVVFHKREISQDEMLAAVIRREEAMGTGMEKGLAVPHARLPNLRRPLIAFGYSRDGIEWDTRDGQRVHFVFLILTPVAERQNLQVQILAAIARTAGRPDFREYFEGKPSDAAKVHKFLNLSLNRSK